jgi:hypothetical protein
MSIRTSNNRDLMKALYWRRINKLSWYDICYRLENRCTPAALRQAASRYIRVHTELMLKEVGL